MKYKTVNNTKHIFVKLLAVFIVFHGGFFVPQAHAATFVWEQTLYGSGILSNIDITPTNLTFSGGTYAHINTIDNALDPYNNLTFVQRVSGPLTLGPGDLSPNTSYFITRGTQTPFDVSVAQNHISQQSNNNVGTAYPYSDGGFYGFVYFETNAASEIECWSTTMGATYPTYPFQNCENTFAPPPYEPPSFNLVAATSSFLSEISSPLIASVQETGANIWPLFVFVGVSLAFVIALQLIVFTKRAVGVNKRTLGGTGRSRGRKNSYSDPMHPDNVAFERGKRANKVDGIDLFPDDK